MLVSCPHDNMITFVMHSQKQQNAIVAVTCFLFIPQMIKFQDELTWNRNLNDLENYRPDTDINYAVNSYAFCVFSRRVSGHFHTNCWFSVLFFVIIARLWWWQRECVKSLLRWKLRQQQHRIVDQKRELQCSVFNLNSGRVCVKMFSFSILFSSESMMNIVGWSSAILWYRAISWIVFSSRPVAFTVFTANLSAFRFRILWWHLIKCNKI